MKTKQVKDLDKRIIEALIDTLKYDTFSETVARIRTLIQEIEAEVRREISEDICKMVDDIELSEIGRSMEEWREFKHIRNAIRDKYEPEGYQQKVFPPEKEEVK